MKNTSLSSSSIYVLHCLKMAKNTAQSSALLCMHYEMILLISQIRKLSPLTHPHRLGIGKYVSFKGKLASDP
jgi:hypothetical protein